MKLNSPKNLGERKNPYIIFDDWNYVRSYGNQKIYNNYRGSFCFCYRNEAEDKTKSLSLNLKFVKNYAKNFLKRFCESYSL